MDHLGSDNFSTLQMKGHVLHRVFLQLLCASAQLKLSSMLFKRFSNFLTKVEYW